MAITQTTGRSLRASRQTQAGSSGKWRGGLARAKVSILEIFPLAGRLRLRASLSSSPSMRWPRRKATMAKAKVVVARHSQVGSSSSSSSFQLETGVSDDRTHLRRACIHYQSRGRSVTLAVVDIQRLLTSGSAKECFATTAKRTETLESSSQLSGSAQKVLRAPLVLQRVKD